MKLTLTAAQQATVDTLKAKLEDALADGAGSIPALPQYKDGPLSAEAKTSIKDSFALQFAAFIQASVNPWTEMTLAAGWTALGGGTYHTPSYRLEGDRVHLRGAVTSILTGTTVTTLPEGYRPAKKMALTAVSFGETATPVVVYVDTDGSVIAPAGTICLDAVSFPV